MLGASAACIALGALGGVVAMGAANGPREAYDAAQVHLGEAQHCLDEAQHALDSVPTCKRLEHCCAWAVLKRKRIWTRSVEGALPHRFAMGKCA